RKEVHGSERQDGRRSAPSHLARHPASDDFERHPAHLRGREHGETEDGRVSRSAHPGRGSGEERTAAAWRCCRERAANASVLQGDEAVQAELTVAARGASEGSESCYATRYPWPVSFGQTRRCPKCGSENVQNYSSVVMPHYPALNQSTRL